MSGRECIKNNNSDKQYDTYDIDIFKWKIYAHFVVKL